MLGLLKLMKEIYKLLIGMNLDKKKIINEKIFIYIIVPFTIIDFVKNSFELDIEYKKYFKDYDCNAFNVNEKQYYKNNLKQSNLKENFVDIPKLSPVDILFNIMK